MSPGEPRAAVALTPPCLLVVHLYNMQITEQLQYIADWLTTQSARRSARAGYGTRWHCIFILF